MLGSFNNWNIIQFTKITTSSEYYYALHEVVLDGISDNMFSILQLGKYCAMITVDPNTMGYYVIPNHIWESK